MYFHWLWWRIQRLQLYNPITKKVVVSRDVKFLEEKCSSDPETPSLVIQQHYLLAHPLRFPGFQAQQLDEQPVDSSSSHNSFRSTSSSDLGPAP